MNISKPNRQTPTNLRTRERKNLTNILQDLRRNLTSSRGDRGSASNKTARDYSCQTIKVNEAIHLTSLRQGVQFAAESVELVNLISVTRNRRYRSRTKNLRPPCGWPLLHFLKELLPTLDNLRNFLLTTTTEMLSFFQQCEKRPKSASYFDSRATGV